MNYLLMVSLTVITVSISGYPTDAKDVLQSEEELLNQQNFEDLNDDDNYSIKVSRGQEVIGDTITRYGHYSSITITVQAFDEIFVLDLTLNSYLFKEGYVEKFFKDGVAFYNKIDHITDHCYYLGNVRNRSQSAAAVSTCKGIAGYFAIGDVAYRIEPQGNQLNSPHKVYRSRGEEKTRFRCGHQSFVSLPNLLQLNRRLKRSFNWPQDFDKSDKVVELYVANDKSQFTARGNSDPAVVQRAKQIVNIASSVYQPLGIYLVLVGIEVWSDADKITINTSNVTETLERWSAYRLNYINPNHANDNAVLILHKSFTNNVIGLATVGRMCSYHNSSALVGDTGSPETAGSVMAHEMGHNFGLQHDDAIPNCPCSDTNGCIMNSVADKQGIPSKTWSQCSLSQLDRAFQYGLDYCLYNVPKTIYENTPICGNGIVETGEQCDCGRANETQCNGYCCDSNCQLVSGATCASGRCCNRGTCQILPCGSSCRKQVGRCDLEEFCDGKVSTCPQDTYQPDGTACNTDSGDSAYCYEGRCKSRPTQCMQIAGAKESDTLCYTDYNTNGDPGGNCGVNWSPGVSYIPCNKSDVMCGRLQCLQAPRNLNAVLIFTIYNRTLGNTICVSAIFDYGPTVQDPGLVPNGAPCGNGSMCVNQKCVNVSSFNILPCGNTCQQNQVCNNLGRCQNKTITISDSCPIIPSSTAGTFKPPTTIKGGSSASSTIQPDPTLQTLALTAIVSMVLGSALAAFTCLTCTMMIAAKCCGFQ